MQSISQKNMNLCSIFANGLSEYCKVLAFSGYKRSKTHPQHKTGCLNLELTFKGQKVVSSIVFKRTNHTNTNHLGTALFLS